MKPVYITTILLCLLFMTGCGSNQKLKSEIIPLNNYDARVVNDSCAIAYATNYEVSAFELKKDELNFFVKNREFLSRKDLIVLGIITANNGAAEIQTGDIILKYNDVLLKPLSQEALNKYLNSADNFQNLYSLYTVDSYGICSGEIDFTNEIIKRKDAAVNPEEKVMRILIFPWIPIEIRNFTLTVQLDSPIFHKQINFRFKRFEYREGGKDFFWERTTDSLYDYY